MKRILLTFPTAIALWSCSPFKENISIEQDSGSSNAPKEQKHPHSQGISLSGSLPLEGSPSNATLVSLGNNYLLQSQTLIQSGRSVSSNGGSFILETYGLKSLEP
jgi:hypothetical protein